MSRKHYRSVAEIIKGTIAGAYTDGEAQIIASVARQLSEEFKRDNSAFRYDYFFEACGLDKWGEIPK